MKNFNIRDFSVVPMPIKKDLAPSLNEEERSLISFFRELSSENKHSILNCTIQYWLDDGKKTGVLEE